jgi:HD-GYP domain-containing protein (c-di-GMP phosphodiesterase class II)
LTLSAGVEDSLAIEFGAYCIERADQALYLAKHSGRNRVCTWLMAELRRLAREIASMGPATVEQRLRLLVSRGARRPGPSQREPITSHEWIVRDICEKLGRALGLGSREMAGPRTAALLRDLGRMLIPEDLLAKHEPLSGVEREIVSRHADFGADLCGCLQIDERIAVGCPCG